MFFFPLAYCMIASQVCQKMLGNVSQYKDFVQCQNRNLQTWHTSSHIEEGIPLHQQCEVRFLVFYSDDIKRCVSGNTKKYVLDWHVVPSIWLVKIGINLLNQKILALEDVGFQLLQTEASSPCRRLSTTAMLSIPCTDFHVPLTANAHPTSRFGKSVRRNLAAPTIHHRNKWESAGPGGCTFLNMYEYT